MEYKEWLIIKMKAVVQDWEAEDINRLKEFRLNFDFDIDHKKHYDEYIQETKGTFQ